MSLCRYFTQLSNVLMLADKEMIEMNYSSRVEGGTHSSQAR